MKRVYTITVLTCLALLALFVGGYKILHPSSSRDVLKVGFIYDNDESTPYTYNFSLAKDAVEKKYGEKVETMTASNVLDDRMEEPLRSMVASGCNIIFFNGYSSQVKELAAEYPDVEFCQTSYMDMSSKLVTDNYHTFKGEAYQGRYVSGIAAGLKIKQMISEGIITEDQAVLGLVASYQTSEVISGYTSFLLGVRSVVPTAVMRVCYTNTWSSFAQEKSAAQKLIKDGCVVLSQYTDTIGPAVACEEAAQEVPVYFVGWNQSMSEVAPISSLVTTRVNWEPYVLAAVDAVMNNKKIETVVTGKIHGTDVSAGFDKGWIEMTDLNMHVAAPGTQEAMASVIEQFMRGRGDFVFRGNYTGVDPNNPSDTINLQNGYTENENTSYPTFHYILKDVITILE